MIVFCEECGERYVIEREDITDQVITFPCRKCKDIIHVSIPEELWKQPADNSKEKAT